MFVIDFEASSLAHNSYPIQVAVCNANDSYSAYLRPQDNWTDWNQSSQDIHNIPRQLLFDVGKPVQQVAEELDAFIGKEIAYCDGGIYDIHWANTLYEAAGMTKSWYYGDVVQYALQGQNRSVQMATGMTWFDFKNHVAEKLELKQHDALNDVKIIRNMAVLLQNGYS